MSLYHILLFCNYSFIGFTQINLSIYTNLKYVIFMIGDEREKEGTYYIWNSE